MRRNVKKNLAFGGKKCYTVRENKEMVSMDGFLRALAVSAAESSEQIESSGGTHPVFWVIVGIAAVGLIIMFIQNFVIKREEYYK